MSLSDTIKRLCVAGGVECYQIIRKHKSGGLVHTIKRGKVANIHTVEHYVIVDKNMLFLGRKVRLNNTKWR